MICKEVPKNHPSLNGNEQSNPGPRIQYEFVHDPFYVPDRYLTNSGNPSLIHCHLDSDCTREGDTCQENMVNFSKYCLPANMACDNNTPCVTYGNVFTTGALAGHCVDNWCEYNDGVIIS